MDLKTRLKKLEQRATDLKTGSQHKENCICFPQGEPLDLTPTERKAAEELQCPLHGRRLPFEIYRSKWLKQAKDSTASKPDTHSSHYRRALAATHSYMEESR
jgi:hypothetical protein